MGRWEVYVRQARAGVCVSMLFMPAFVVEAKQGRGGIVHIAASNLILLLAKILASIGN